MSRGNVQKPVDMASLISHCSEQRFAFRTRGELVAVDPKSTVQSVVKAFGVIRAFDSTVPELTLSQIAARASLDRGTTFRLVNTLVDLGSLRAVVGSKRYRLTLKCLELGFSA